MPAPSKPASIPALRAPAPKRDNPLTRSLVGMLGMGFLALMLLACLGSLPYTLGAVSDTNNSPRYDHQYRTARHLPPTWWGIETPPANAAAADTQASRLDATTRILALETIARERTESSGSPVTVESLIAQNVEPTPEQLAAAKPFYLLGTDVLGRDMLIRCLAGGGISLGIGIAAATLSVFLGTLYGALSGYIGGRTDAVMMRIVDILYGLPYVLLVVLLAVAVEALLDNWQLQRASEASQARTAYIERELAALNDSRRADPAIRDQIETQARSKFPPAELSRTQRHAVQILTLLIAIGGVSWLTMSRVVRGQVLSLKQQPFMEAARAMGVPVWGLRGIFIKHLLPNLIGPITVYATLTVPQAILQESFLSFLGIGVKPPLPSWGNLAADGLAELNPYRSNWWLLLFPCLLLGLTLLSLNFVGEGLRESLDPKRSRR